MPQSSDLIRLPARELAELALRWLEIERGVQWFTNAQTMWACGVGEDENAELFLIALPGAEPEHCVPWVEKLPGVDASEGPTCRRWTLLDLRPGKQKADRLLPEVPQGVSLTVLRPQELAERLHQGRLRSTITAWSPEPSALTEQIEEHELLLEFVEAELVADQYTKLSAAGGDKQRRTHLARVFVDLRVGSKGPNQAAPPRFASELLRLAATPRVLDRPSVLLGSEGLRRVDGRASRPRVLLVGGPGQGKTTLGMHLCQVFRAALLTGRGRRSSSKDATEILKDLRPREEMRAVVGRRIPVRIVLHHLAAQLASGAVTDLWSYLARYAQKRVGHDRITADMLRSWLRDWPSLLVLDGLDEVPASANRDQVLRAVHDMLAELDRAQADQVVVATTRPQGYRGELSSQDWTRLSLEAFSDDEATDYAGRLLEQWVRGDRVRRDELLERVRRAVADSGTAQLSKSPLQVTILCTLVEQSGRPPRDRWRLFREYFRIIYDRERERGIPAVEILSDQREVVERLHEEVGYRLHLRAERARGTDPGLPAAEIDEIITRMLEAEGHRDPELSRLVGLVSEAVADRLVFLVPQGESSVGFEIRSLQEFFAAERLFWGEEGLLRSRLEAIAVGTHWRNTLCFAVGRIAAERNHLLDRIPALCDRLDALEGGLGAQARLGARLAVDLLGEGAVLSRPKLREILARRALDGFGDLDLLWGDVLVANLGSGAREELLAAMDEGLQEGRSSAWEVVVKLALLRDHKARELVDRRVEGREVVFGEVIARYAFGDRWDVWCEEIFQRTAYRWPLEFVCSVVEYMRRPIRDDHAPQLRAHTVDLHFSRSIQQLKTTRGVGGVICSLLALPATPPIALPNDTHPSWAALRAVHEFASHPDRHGLGRALTLLSACDARTVAAARAFAPWPLAACMQPDSEERSRLRQLADEGALGDSSDWRAAERRWVNRPIRLRDLCTVYSPTRPIGPDLATAGIPHGARMFVEPALVLEVYERAGRDALKAILQNTSYLYGDEWHSIPDDHEFWTLLQDTERFTAVQMLIGHALRALSLASLQTIFAVPDAYWFLGHALSTHSDSSKAALANLLLMHLPTEPGLLRVIAAIMEVRAWPPASDFQPDPTTFDAPELRALATVLQAWKVQPADAQTLAEQILAYTPSNPETWWRVYNLLVHHHPSGGVELLRNLLPNVEDKLPLLQALHTLLASRAAPLHHPAAAAALELPADAEAALDPADCAAAQRADPVQLGGIHLRDLRAWERLDLQLDPNPDQGQWLYFVGENGTGKTTLLRAIALALVGAGTAQGFVARVSGPLVRTGQASGEAQVALGDGRKGTLRIAGAEVVPNGPPPEILVVGYGPRRGTLLGQTRQELNFSPGEAVETLFIEGGNLIHARTWLFELERRALRNKHGPDADILQSVKGALLRLLPGVEHIDIDSDEVYVRGPGVGEVPLSAVSDGYLTTAGWVIDLMARWMDRERVAGRTPGPAFTEHMTGLVLIDEIDLHLHPRWQWSLIDDLRRVFPRLSFVVTTHNPVTLLSARPGEIYVIDRDPAGQLRATQRDIPPGTGIEQVLTGTVFGLPSAVDPGTARLLDEHRALLRAAPDSPRRAELEIELRRRLGRFNDSSLEGMAASVTAQTLRENADRLTADEREQARERAVETLRRMLKREAR